MIDWFIYVIGWIFSIAAAVLGFFLIINHAVEILRKEGKAFYLISEYIFYRKYFKFWFEKNKGKDVTDFIPLKHPKKEFCFGCEIETTTKTNGLNELFCAQCGLKH